MNDEKKPTDAVREFAERYERRIAELESKLAAECQHAREGWENCTLTLDRLDAESANLNKWHEKAADLEIELETAREERTCRMEYQTDGMQCGWWKCSECGGAMDTIEACGGRKPPRWCGNCGAKVVFGCNDREGAQ